MLNQRRGDVKSEMHSSRFFLATVESPRMNAFVSKFTKYHLLILPVLRQSGTAK